MSELIDDIDLIENAEPRIACVLLLDTSTSMEEEMPALNEGLQSLLSAIRQDELASKRVELAVIEFNSEARIIQEFTTVENLESIDPLFADGLTSMGTAIIQGVDLIEKRKTRYKTNGIPYYRPWLFIMTDGMPTDTDKVDQASELLRISLQNKGLTVFPIGIGNGVDYESLKRITHVSPKKLGEDKWQELFNWVSASLSVVSSSRPGDINISLPSYDSWESTNL